MQRNEEKQVLEDDYLCFPECGGGGSGGGGAVEEKSSPARVKSEKAVARCNRKMARQRSNKKVAAAAAGAAASPPPPCSTSVSSPDAVAPTSPCPPHYQQESLFPSLEYMGLRFVLQKELKNSDVTSIGRIVLPKRESEANLPFLAMKEGIQLTIRELFSPFAWRMRYRFWPNNKSRMYVLENTGDFVKHQGLKCGDCIALYQDENKQLYICARRLDKPSQQQAQSSRPETEAPAGSGSLPGREIAPEEQERGVVPTAGVDGGGLMPPGVVDYQEDGCCFPFGSPATPYFESGGGGCSLRQLEGLLSFDDCDLSLYDVDKDGGNKGGGDGVVK